MKTKTYRYGKLQFKAYLKPVGHGIEVGLHFDGKNIFVGNFIHSREANQWWTRLNREVSSFLRRFQVSDDAPRAWFCEFFAAHLYKCYYTFLDRVLAKHGRNYNRVFLTSQRKYNKLRKNWDKDEIPYLRAV